MKHPRLQLNKRAFWCGVAVLVLLRCGLTSFQQAYTWVGGAPLDDELMFRAAQAITAGEWLGAYDYLTLSKAMFFSIEATFAISAACAAPAVSGQRGSTVVRSFTAGGLCLCAAVA